MTRTTLGRSRVRESRTLGSVGAKPNGLATRPSPFVALDQLRTVDRHRLVKRLGRLTPSTVTAVLEGLQEMFAE